MIRVIPSNKLLIIYLALSGITYLGLLTNNLFGVYFGLALFIVFTSYVLSWYLLTILTALYSQLAFSQDNVELMVGSSTVIGIRILSKIPLRWEARLTLIHPPHIQSSVIKIRVNDGDFMVKLTGKWIGEVKIIGGIIDFEEPLRLLLIQSLLLNNGVNVVIRPRQLSSAISKVEIDGYTEYGALMEGRLGDFKSLSVYDYERSASTIHWLTSARVNELMMINRSDYGSCPIFIMNSSSRVLIPQNNERPIDKALQAISDLSQHCGEVSVVLVSKDHVEQKILSKVIIPYLEREIRIKMIRSCDINNVTMNIPDYFRKYIDYNKLLEIAYIRSPLGDEPSIDELNKALSTVSNRDRVILLNIDLGN
ncbi:MAG: DUF58 domain-containing protein [Vulcanisaeta sp.]|uniref:DUF58 domain-containing protein n=1 Tax=Vulcanisaeta sp. TaxID=2020871 RepID=UPI003D0FD55A